MHYKDSYRSSALLCVRYVKEVLPFFIIIIKYTLKIGQEVLDIQCDNWYFLSGNFTYIHVSLMCGAIWKNRIKDYSCTFLYCTPYILISYWVTQKLPQICTIFYYPYWEGCVIYIFAVTSGSPSILLICNPQKFYTD